MDQLVFALIIFAIPATILATLFHWLSVEYALGIVWAVALLTIVLGLIRVREPTPPGESNRGQ